MPGRVRLLTFDRLPDRGGAAGIHVPADTRDHLTGRSAVFENHYLQEPGLQSILDPFRRGIWPEFSRGVNSGRFNVAAFFALPGSAGTVAAEELPSWLNTTIVDQAPADSVWGPSPGQLERLAQADFCWLHFDFVMDETQESLFRRTAEIADALTTGPDDVAMFTALNGTPAHERVAFRSLLWEGRVRVPLWIQGPGQHDVRVQTITGSFDIACTICGLLEGTWPNEAVAADRPVDLISLARCPGRRTDRELHIRHGGVDAIRTGDFMFVQRSPGTDSGDSGVERSASALYAKPEDVWNVNDVSAEYFEVVEAFRRTFE